MEAPALRKDPVLIGAVAWTAVAAILFCLAGTTWQVRTFWFFQLPLDGLLAYSSWRVFRIATGPTRRFWAVLGTVGSLFLVGDSFQTVLVFAMGPGIWSTTGGIVQSACFMVGLAAIVIAMLVHPHPGRSGRERLAFWLDSATVLVGGAVIAWSFAVQPGQASRTDILSTLGASAVAVTSTFAAVKMILSGNAPMRKSAAISMISSAGFTLIGLFIAPPTVEALPAYVYVVRLMPSLLIALGPRTQEIIARFDPVPFGERRRKPYSLLPYGSIVIAFVTLIVIMPDGVSARMWGVVVGLGLICALVAGRQLAAFHDNTDLIKRLREHEARLRRQTETDGLTGLANRNHFHDQLAAALDAPGTEGVSVLLVDLDGFKGVNDTLGHAAGDALLVSVADKMRAALRDGDVAARLGGDEFAILLYGCPPAETEQTAQRILDALARPVELAGAPVCAQASIGAAGARPGDEVGSLMRRADMAMYAAKSAGKGRWLRYDAEMEHAVSFH
ncbi:diguanylate cyclase domain-containing protein [Actinoplanes sp. CA-030573]|uniref:diguanylate cyclase domain-containing protein n=1 Tax=Actinoplanes sp. CA-030573 TaxID=3239898 RepID=UPI003D8F1F00